MKKLSDIISQLTDGPDGPTTMFVINGHQKEWDTEEEMKCNYESMTFNIKPLEGIKWNGQNIPLGSSKKEVEDVFGQPEIMEGSYYYFESELRFDFDKNETVEFIEFLGGIDGALQPELYGVKVFEIEADELKKILKEQNAGDIDDSENGYSYAFLNLSIGVYRERIPEDIEEMKADGIDIENNEDLEEEKKMARHWATIGVGTKGYYC